MNELGKRRLDLLNSIAQNLGQPTDSRVKVATLVAEMAEVKSTTLLQATYGQCHLSTEAIDRIKARLQSHHWAEQLNYDVLRNPNHATEATQPPSVAEEESVVPGTSSPAQRRGRPPRRGVTVRTPAPAPTVTSPPLPIGSLPFTAPIMPTGGGRKVTLTLPHSAALSDLEIDLSGGYLVVRLKL